MVIQVGEEHQAIIPPLQDHLPISPSHGKLDIQQNDSHEDRCMWVPLPTEKWLAIKSYLRESCIEYNYNEEQALLMYHVTGGHIAGSSQLMEAYIPYPDTWSVAEKTTLLTAAYFHKKNFHKIKNELLKNRSMQEIVSTYYATKRRAYFLYSNVQLEPVVRNYYLHKCHSTENKDQATRTSAIACSSQHIPRHIRAMFDATPSVCASRQTVPTLTRNFLGNRDERRVRCHKRHEGPQQQGPSNPATHESEQPKEPARKQARLESSGGVADTVSTTSRASSGNNASKTSPLTSNSNGATDTSTVVANSPKEVVIQPTQTGGENESSASSCGSEGRRSSTSSSPMDVGGSAPGNKITSIAANFRERLVPLISSCYGFTEEEHHYLMKKLWIKHDKLLREAEFDSRPERITDHVEMKMEKTNDDQKNDDMTREQARILNLLSHPPKGWADSREGKLFKTIFASKGIPFAYRLFDPRNFTYLLPLSLQLDKKDTDRESDESSLSSSESRSVATECEQPHGTGRESAHHGEKRDQDADCVEGHGNDSRRAGKKSSRPAIHPQELRRLLEQYLMAEGEEEPQSLTAPSSPPPGARKKLLRFDDDSNETISFAERVKKADDEFERLKAFATSESVALHALTSKITAKWEIHEVQVLLYGVTVHGLDFQALADLVMSKTATQIRHFLEKYGKRLELNTLLSVYPPSSRPAVTKTSPNSRTSHSPKTSAKGTARGGPRTPTRRTGMK